MDQLITNTNHALQRLRSAKTAAEVEIVRKELEETHLPAFSLLDSEHQAYGANFEALVRWMLKERRDALHAQRHDHAAQDRLAARVRVVASSRR